MRGESHPVFLFLGMASMGTNSAALDGEPKRQLKRIEELETKLFFKRLRFIGLKSTKNVLLRELVVGEEEVRQVG
jgi:hypothetical protein